MDRFVGLPYRARSMDCADLHLLVQRELFGREVSFAGPRPRPLREPEQAEQLTAWTHELARPTDTPSDGDIVLMLDSGQTVPGHVGTFFFLAHESWVLHTTHALGSSVLHRLRDLPSYGLRVEGFYRWI